MNVEVNVSNDFVGVLNSNTSVNIIEGVDPDLTNNQQMQQIYFFTGITKKKVLTLLDKEYILKKNQRQLGYFIGNFSDTMIISTKSLEHPINRNILLIKIYLYEPEQVIISLNSTIEEIFIITNPSE